MVHKSTLDETLGRISSCHLWGLKWHVCDCVAMTWTECCCGFTLSRTHAHTHSVSQSHTQRLTVKCRFHRLGKRFISEILSLSFPLFFFLVWKRKRKKVKSIRIPSCWWCCLGITVCICETLSLDLLSPVTAETALNVGNNLDDKSETKRKKRGGTCLRVGLFNYSVLVLSRRCCCPRAEGAKEEEKGIATAYLRPEKIA